MISKEDIEGLAQLARLKLHAGEAENLQKDISNILGYVSQIESFATDTKKTDKPMLRNVMRDDLLRADADPLADKEESLRSQFPRREGNYNVVRKIIQKDE